MDCNSKLSPGTTVSLSGDSTPYLNIQYRLPGAGALRLQSLKPGAESTKHGCNESNWQTTDGGVLLVMDKIYAKAAYVGPSLVSGATVPYAIAQVRVVKGAGGVTKWQCVVASSGYSITDYIRTAMKPDGSIISYASWIIRSIYITQQVADHWKTSGGVVVPGSELASTPSSGAVHEEETETKTHTCSECGDTFDCGDGYSCCDDNNYCSTTCAGEDD